MKRGLLSKSSLFLLVLSLVVLMSSIALAASAYTVKPGDTLAKIAIKTGVSVKKLVELNNINDATLIYPGEILKLDAKAPKYVFYFIGDGLGAAQRQLAEYYFKYQSKDQNAKLVMDKFPVAGINTTYSSDSLVTDSAAAGTALATGYKTNNGVISELPNGNKIKTLLEGAKSKGMATGLVSTTRLTHATPATFATHIDSRNKENEIAAQYVESGVEYLAAGGYRYFVPKNGDLKSKRKDDRDLVKEFKGKGYNTFISEADTSQFRRFVPQGKDKVVALFTYSHMPYEVDRDVNKVPSLAEMTEKGIDVLSQYENGFFMMIEGGRIDHAAHANDPVGMVHDTLAFDRAISKAYKFYQAHPKETLIVVAGDHETGGVGLGFAKNYFLNVDILTDAKVSTADVLNYGEGKYDGDRAKFFDYIAKNLGLRDLTAKEKAEIEKNMDMVDKGHKGSAGEYGGYDPVAIATTHVLSERANLQWTTYAHSATSIPLSAIGVGADSFGGYKDNTEIAKEMSEVMAVQLGK
ncbi:alkaline phosphatase [Orenia metallireducens]|uniref:Alkaline phosphatase n=1 Tax=Orenia metallireducens TaxID=1413210 RepID=A0A285GWH1_9FIRM|nr:alkaline phosphatase [Orenia metallireducens]PRX31066.1 alkaline phosphatase [Orenia metallireducens]SNY27798.1 alkaline phosphatase [Orenia metallireducens]